MVYFDRNHNGRRDAGEPGVAGKRVAEGIITAADGTFRGSLSADPAYGEPVYTIGGRTVRLTEGQVVTGLEVADVCEVRGQGAEDLIYWKKKARLRSGDPLEVLELNLRDGKVDGDATVRDPVAGDWTAIRELAARAKSVAAYRPLLEQLNRNQADITPSTPAKCRP
jgi:hypothetical protein